MFVASARGQLWWLPPHMLHVLAAATNVAAAAAAAGCARQVERAFDTITINHGHVVECLNYAIDVANHPCLIHCFDGSESTGLAIMCASGIHSPARAHARRASRARAPNCTGLTIMRTFGNHLARIPRRARAHTPHRHSRIMPEDPFSPSRDAMRRAHVSRLTSRFPSPPPSLSPSRSPSPSPLCITGKHPSPLAGLRKLQMFSIEYYHSEFDR